METEKDRVPKSSTGSVIQDNGMPPQPALSPCPTNPYPDIKQEGVGSTHATSTVMPETRSQVCGHSSSMTLEHPARSYLSDSDSDITFRSAGHPMNLQSKMKQKIKSLERRYREIVIDLEIIKRVGQLKLEARSDVEKKLCQLSVVQMAERVSKQAPENTNGGAAEEQEKIQSDMSPETNLHESWEGTTEHQLSSKDEVKDDQQPSQSTTGTAQQDEGTSQLPPAQQQHQMQTGIPHQYQQQQRLQNMGHQFARMFTLAASGNQGLTGTGSSSLALPVMAPSLQHAYPAGRGPQPPLATFTSQRMYTAPLNTVNYPACNQQRTLYSQYHRSGRYYEQTGTRLLGDRPMVGGYYGNSGNGSIPMPVYSRYNMLPGQQGIQERPMNTVQNTDMNLYTNGNFHNVRLPVNQSVFPYNTMQRTMYSSHQPSYSIPAPNHSCDKTVTKKKYKKKGQKKAIRRY